MYVESDDEWLSPLDALSVLGELYGDLAKPALVRAIQAGKVGVSVKKLESYVDYGHRIVMAPTKDQLTTSEHVACQAYNIMRSSDREGEAGPAMFNRSPCWDNDVATWDWYESNFRATFSLEPVPVRARLIGVRLKAADIKDRRRFNRYADECRKAAATRPSYTRATKWDWEGMLIQLIAKANADGLDQLLGSSGRGQQARLERWIAGTMTTTSNATHPDETEIRDRARKILKTMASYKTLI